MTTHMLASLYDYGEWANERLLGQATKLTDEQFRRRWSAGAQSIHETFVHILNADWRWLHRWRQVALPPRLVPGEYPSIGAIRAKWTALYPERRAYLAALPPADLEAETHHEMEGRRYTFARWQAILHCANHATQHRSEIAAMLTDAGHSPGDLDYLVFGARVTT